MRLLSNADRLNAFEGADTSRLGVLSAKLLVQSTLKSLWLLAGDQFQKVILSPKKILDISFRHFLKNCKQPTG
jgi:hypothetical protein